MTTGERDDSRQHDHAPTCWDYCWMPARVGGHTFSLTGLVLLIVGVLWLASNFNIIDDWGNWAGPLVLIALGAIGVWGYRNRKGS